ncbi:Eisosome component PIL1-domain-containing protein [Dichotomocladium elegans]|nr:Eisosome component PIL1-domain-containing protein [Dichotomocladium elegans]
MLGNPNLGLSTWYNVHSPLLSSFSILRKMNFKDLQFSIGKLTTAAQSHIARKNPLQNQETKTLSGWIFEERNVLSNMRTLTYHHSETNKAMDEWINEECQNAKEEDNKDLKDIGSKLLVLFKKQIEIEEAYTAKYQQYRRTIKAIRDREERLTDAREKKKALQSRIDNLTRTNAKSSKARDISKELDALERDTHDMEMEMGDFKRFALREAFYLRFNAMHEMAEKLVIIAGFAKYIADLIDIEPTQPGQPHRRPYDKSAQASQILHDALRALETWAPAEGMQRPTLPETFGDDTVSVAGGDDRLSVVNNDNAPSSSFSGASSPKPSAPNLPPRPKETATATATPEITGDVKTRGERVADFEQQDFYGPPPAYSPDGRSDAYSPRNSDEPPVVHPPPAVLRNEATQPQAHPRASPNSEGITLFDTPAVSAPNTRSPTVASAALRQSQDKVLDESEEEMHANRAACTPVPHHILEGYYSQSPQPVHQEQLQPTTSTPAQHAQLYHPSSTCSQVSQTPAYFSYGYTQLYHKVSLRQRQAPPQMPYDQFKEQHHRPRVDPGGFCFPPAVGSSGQYPSAEEEKQALSQRYGTT